MAAKMLQLTFSRGLALERNSVKTHVFSDTLQEKQPKKQMRTEVNSKQMQTDVNRCIQMYIQMHIHLFTSAYGLVGFFERRCKQMQTDVPTSAYIWLHLFTSAYTCLDRCTLM